MQKNKDKLAELLFTGQSTNIELAFQLARSQGIDISSTVDIIRYFYINGSKGSIRNANLADEVSISDMISAISAYRYASFSTHFKQQHYKALALLKQLDELYFYYPSFKTLPKELYLLKDLWRLVILDGNLQQITKKIKQLQKLRILRLTNNKINFIADEIGNLLGLQELYLNNNNLSVLPKSIGQLSNLKILFLGSNQLTTLPKELKELRMLKKFSVYGNPLQQAEIPDCLFEGNGIVAKQLRRIFP
ncbi:MAG: leucine-rich repeat domain-containing protein [Saprospiraceae bacterium]|nr:leucine-rich repeat domain-containing protein [Saprospiraceae bacterium]